MDNRDKIAVQNIAIDLIVAMNAAITNVRLYPPTSALIVNSVERMARIAESLFGQIDSVSFAESEKSLLIQGDPLSEKNQKKPQMVSFVSLMLDLGIRSISLEKGVLKKELTDFIQIMGKTDDDIRNSGGIQKLFDGLGVTHVRIDEQVYVKMDSEHTIVAGMDMKDTDIVKHLLGDDAVSEETVAHIREMLRDPELVSKVFQQGIRRLVSESSDQENAFEEAIGQMVDQLAEASGSDRPTLTQMLLNSLNDMSEEMLLTVVTRDMGALFGESAVKTFLENLDESTFSEFSTKISKIAETVIGNEAYSESRQQSVKSMLKLVKESRKTENVETPEKQAPPSPVETEKQVKVEKLKNALSTILQGKAAEFPDVSNVGGLAGAVEQLYRKGKAFTVDAILKRLGEALLHDDSKVRFAAADMLAKIDQRLELADAFEERVKLSKKLSEWIKFETEISPVYEQITERLRNLSQTLILNEREDDAEHILEAYNRIYTGNLAKDEAIRALSENMLQNLATEDILELLLKQSREEDGRERKKDIFSMILLGTTTVEMLLDRLHDSHNRLERNRIIQVVTRIGEPAIIPVAERIPQAGPWFYTRNLVLLMGRIGRADHLKILETALGHEDIRVQREAVFAIQNIGGPDIEEIFLRHLNAVDDETKATIISVLGLMKSAMAVPVLIEILETRSLGKNKKLKTNILIKSCEALGRIGDSLAIPALKKIRHSKGFLAIGASDPELRGAAKDALKMFKSI